MFRIHKTNYVIWSNQKSLIFPFKPKWVGNNVLTLSMPMNNLKFNLNISFPITNDMIYDKNFC